MNRRYPTEAVAVEPAAPPMPPIPAAPLELLEVPPPRPFPDVVESLHPPGSVAKATTPRSALATPARLTAALFIFSSSLHGRRRTVIPRGSLASQRAKAGDRLVSGDQHGVVSAPQAFIAVDQNGLPSRGWRRGRMHGFVRFSGLPEKRIRVPGISGRSISSVQARWSRADRSRRAEAELMVRLAFRGLSGRGVVEVGISRPVLMLACQSGAASLRRRRRSSHRGRWHWPAGEQGATGEIPCRRSRTTGGAATTETADRRTVGARRDRRSMGRPCSTRRSTRQRPRAWLTVASQHPRRSRRTTRAPIRRRRAHIVPGRAARAQRRAARRT